MKRLSSTAKSVRKSGGVVRFEVTDLAAREVFVAGTFNDWHPAVTPMIHLGNGRWAKEVVLPPGVYEYLFVADGHWLPDPRAKACVPNPFGGMNSRLQVTAG